MKRLTQLTAAVAGLGGALALLAPATLPAEGGPIIEGQTAGPFLEEDGFIAFEMESATAPGWVVNNNEGGFSGDGYLTWTGGDLFFSPGQGVITYFVVVQNPGEYQLRIRNIYRAPAIDLNNDLWLSVNGSEFEKSYSNPGGYNNWSWETKLEEQGHRAASFFLNQGENIIQISGRSNNFNVDRMHLYLPSVADPLNLNNPISPNRGLIPTKTFTFDTDAEGWKFTAPGGSFGPSWGSYEQGMLTTILNGSLPSFAFWESPVTGFEGTSEGSYSFYEIAWTLKSNRPQADNPAIRLRASRPDFNEIYSYEVFSTGNGAATPNAEGKVYRQFFQQGNGNPFFLLNADVIRTDPSDNPNGSIMIDQVEMRTLYVSELIEGIDFSQSATKASWNFTGANANGFTPLTIDGFDAPPLNVTNGGLQIGGSQSNGNIMYGGFERNTGVVVEANTLYEIQARFSSNAPAAAETQKAAIRLRANTPQSSASIMIESVNEAAPLPLLGDPETYRLWFYPDQSQVGQSLLVALEMIHIPGSGNTPEYLYTIDFLDIIGYNITDLQ